MVTNSLILIVQRGSDENCSESFGHNRSDLNFQDAFLNLFGQPMHKRADLIMTVRNCSFCIRLYAAQAAGNQAGIRPQLHAHCRTFSITSDIQERVCRVVDTLTRIPTLRFLNVSLCLLHRRIVDSDLLRNVGFVS